MVKRRYAKVFKYKIIRRLIMEFSYENITIGDLDVEFNYINFGMVCDGDNHKIICGMIEDEDNTKR